MGVGSGQPLDELYCPTCGLQIRDFTPYVENAEEVFSVDSIRTDIKQEGMRRYLACPHGHRWTIAMIWRVRGQPDRVQLGEYMGLT